MSRGRDLAGLVEARLGPRPPHVVGIAGAVAVGKSTIARDLAARLCRRNHRVAVVATDAFLHPNAVLASRDLLYKKGYPESFDTAALTTFLEAVRADAFPIDVPVYSHETYDVVPGERTRVEHADVVIVEGVIALQRPVVDLLDVAVYVDADEGDVFRWFEQRFLALVDEARTNPASFYAMFASMQREQVRAVAQRTWEAINGPNLREHIAPSRVNAGLVAVKGADHSVREVLER